MDGKLNTSDTKKSAKKAKAKADSKRKLANESVTEPDGKIHKPEMNVLSIDEIKKRKADLKLRIKQNETIVSFTEATNQSNGGNDSISPGTLLSSTMIGLEVSDEGHGKNTTGLMDVSEDINEFSDQEENSPMLTSPEIIEEMEKSGGYLLLPDKDAKTAGKATLIRPKDSYGGEGHSRSQAAKGGTAFEIEFESGSDSEKLARKKRQLEALDIIKGQMQKKIKQRALEKVSEMASNDVIMKPDGNKSKRGEVKPIVKGVKNIKVSRSSNSEESTSKSGKFFNQTLEQVMAAGASSKEAKRARLNEIEFDLGKEELDLELKKFRERFPDEIQYGVYHGEKPKFAANSPQIADILNLAKIITEVPVVFYLVPKGYPKVIINNFMREMITAETARVLGHKTKEAKNKMVSGTLQIRTDSTNLARTILELAKAKTWNNRSGAIVLEVAGPNFKPAPFIEVTTKSSRTTWSDFEGFFKESYDTTDWRYLGKHTNGNKDNVHVILITIDAAARMGPARFKVKVNDWHSTASAFLSRSWCNLAAPIEEVLEDRQMEEYNIMEKIEKYQRALLEKEKILQELEDSDDD